MAVNLLDTMKGSLSTELENSKSMFELAKRLLPIDMYPEVKSVALKLESRINFLNSAVWFLNSAENGFIQWVEKIDYDTASMLVYRIASVATDRVSGWAMCNPPKMFGYTTYTDTLSYGPDGWGIFYADSTGIIHRFSVETDV